MGVARPQRRRARREEVDPAALALIARHGAEILAAARRYSASLDDAEDAYQRALEILLTKAPPREPPRLAAWMHTVTKHEAMAVRRARDRLLGAELPARDGEAAGLDSLPGERPGPVERAERREGATHDQAERYERLRLGAEAMKRLKPQEIRCLLLKAEGYSYKEICEITGWTYTKVNRCLTEGRRAFLERVAGIEGGVECERLAPLVSLLADGELTAEELRMLRPHLRSCLACRARLREYRAAPERVAALVPAAALAGGAAGAGDTSLLRGLVESLIGATGDRAAALGERVHAATELATAQKAAAVAAAAAAVAGGGVGVDQLGRHGASARDRPAEVRQAAGEQPKPPGPRPPTQTAPASSDPAASDPAPSEPAPNSAPQPAPPPPPEPAPDPTNEFTPAPAPAAASPEPPPSPEGLAPGGAAARGSAGGGEFGP